MIKWMGSLVGKLFIVAGALIMSQMPLFMQYYTQQLAGRVSELQWQMEGVEQLAAKSGKNLDQYIQKFLVSDDLDFRQQGQFMKETNDRWRDFSTNLSALQQATAWTKPFVFLQKLNWTIMLATYDSYEPGLTLNIEGAVFALAGMGIGALLFSLIKHLFIWMASPLKLLRRQKQTVKLD
jgi:Protein of unknown function (DUF2937)